jgi:Rieske Fe-S protein
VISRRELLILSGCAAASACGGPDLAATLTPASGAVILTFTQFPTLASAGGGVLVGVTGKDPIAVVRTSDTAVVALDAICTHEGCTLGLESTLLHCDCHGSEFAFDGSVTHGPANRPLHKYAATLNSDSIVVTVG